jgi:hypothetical protein
MKFLRSALRMEWHDRVLLAILIWVSAATGAAAYGVHVLLGAR